MAAGTSCFFSPAFSTVSSSTKPHVSTLATTVSPAGGWREHQLRCLKKVASRPRLEVRAHNRDAHSQPNPRPPAAGHYFRSEMDQISQFYHEMINANHGLLFIEANSMSASVCNSANKALALASLVMDSAGPNVGAGAPSEITAETYHRTVRPYAGIFFRAAKDAYRRKVNKMTVVSFLRALRGLAAVSHILLEDALEAVAHGSATDGVLEYAFNSDVEVIYHEFKQRMSGLEYGILSSRNKPSMESWRLVEPTILAGTMAARSFVGLTVNRRDRALKKASA